jgi:hypothetical protein
MDVFFPADDKQEYLDQLSQSASKHWCLVSNHAPFVVLAVTSDRPRIGSKKRNADMRGWLISWRLPRHLWQEQ